MICDNLSVNKDGHLTFAGYDTVKLARKYGTPLYIMDENKIREHVRTYKNAMEDFFPEGSCPEFASKAFSVKRIYSIMAEEGIDADVVSQGEIYTAFKSGFPMNRVFFHGNNKTDSEIAFAMDCKVGYFVVDGIEELYAVQSIAKEKGIIQKILIRVSPGIDPHTHKKISTGSTESKFGFPIETGAAKEAVNEALKCENVYLSGLHCHIGSQIFESEPFVTAAEIMAQFIADTLSPSGKECEILNLGGGLGVRYTEDDPEIDYREKISGVAQKLDSVFKKNGLKVPVIHMEPGRSLVADAGMTLYSVGSVKEIKGYKNYVSVDGGMTDNPRYALYEAVHSVILASRADAKCDFCATVAGRCCESGDLIGEDVLMPKPSRNEILAVLTTGAYNYSMASNYNRVPRPAVVMLDGKRDYLAVKRETLDDIIRLDV